MVNMTITLPKELKEKMAQFPQINWSEVARGAIQKEISDMEFLDYMRKDSTLTEEDAIKMGREVKKRAYERFKREYGLDN